MAFGTHREISREKYRKTTPMPHAERIKYQKIRKFTNLKLKFSVGAIAGARAFAMTVPTAANAAPMVAPQQTPTVAAADVFEVNQLTTGLETLFTEVITYDANGVVAFDAQSATELLGSELAADLEQQLSQKIANSLSNSASRQMFAQQSFVDCMVQNSVIGLVSGVVGGAFIELVKQKAWTALAEARLPRLVRAGVTGGVAGVVASLAAFAVQCTWFND
jgi:hypothetical protein